MDVVDGIIIPDAKNGTPACERLERALRYMLDANSKARFDAKMRQAQIAAEYQNGETHFGVLGHHRLAIDLQDYIFWNAAEPGCFYDKDFLREWERDNPQCVVKSPKSKYVSCGGIGK
ncbi:MAG: hypothetical protein IJI37_00695 [Opitutales bacterium]|nr:hypothetical protein [Opitutales bacterium]